jgi:hypothetical protein
VTCEYLHFLVQRFTRSSDFLVERFNLEVSHIVGDPASWKTLKPIDLKVYSCILVINDELEMTDVMVSDSRNLAIILLLRHHQDLIDAELGREASTRAGYN